MAYSIQVQDLTKRYRLGQSHMSLKSALKGWRRNEPERFHWAVKNVNFALEPGEAMGIIGPNGAGKTTILKLLSQVTKPTSGNIDVAGRMSALIELGAGFHPDLTGRDNVYLNGTILGLRRSEIRARFDQIVEFAGIGKYLDTPVKRYSSGMYARLGFAIAAHVDPDVLLVDEVLAVGDYAFQQKCHARMEELRKSGTSLVLVSHNMDAVRQVCSKGLVMYRGANLFQGSASEAIVAYSNAVRQAAREAQVHAPVEGGLSERIMTFDAEITEVGLLDAQRKPVTVLRSGAGAVVVVDVCYHQPVSNPIFALTIRTPDGRVIYDTTTRWMKIETPSFQAGERCQVEFALDVPLLDGEYEIGVDVAAADLRHYYDRIERAMGFWVESRNGAQGLVDLRSSVTIKEFGRETSLN